MKIHCPRPECISASNPSPKTSHFIRNGHYFRKSDSRFVQRFQCLHCGKQFSHSTLSSTYFQKKRRITHALFLALNSGVTQRRCAENLRINRKTVVRRYRYLAEQGRIEHKRWMKKVYGKSPLQLVQFDDLEASEHTKCKPLSVSLAVDPLTRKILSFQVSSMPAKGLLAAVAFRKYGYREDKRPEGWDQMMKELIPFVSPTAVWKSDQNPHYPKYLFQHHPQATHQTVKGARGTGTGQDELKKLGFDPLFTLNHTCAMLRANLSRLVRKTWSNTKNRQGLIDHLSIYVRYHNLVRTRGPKLHHQS